MNIKLKPYFKNNLIKNFINIKKTGPKLYYNNKNFVTKNKSNFNKYITGHNYTIKLCDLNTLLLKSFTINKKDKEYANYIMYSNMLYSSLFCKKNVR